MAREGELGVRPEGGIAAGQPDQVTDAPAALLGRVAPPARRTERHASRVGGGAAASPRSLTAGASRIALERDRAHLPRQDQKPGDGGRSPAGRYRAALGDRVQPVAVSDPGIAQPCRGATAPEGPGRDRVDRAGGMGAEQRDAFSFLLVPFGLATRHLGIGVERSRARAALSTDASALPSVCAECGVCADAGGAPQGCVSSPRARASYGHHPDQVPINECAAWRLAAALGEPLSDLVAPCVMWSHHGEAGALVQGLRGVNRTRDPFAKARDQCSHAAFFDSLVAHQDRHIGNLRWDAAGGRLGLYDHGYTFALAGHVLNA